MFVKIRYSIEKHMIIVFIQYVKCDPMGVVQLFIGDHDVSRIRGIPPLAAIEEKPLFSYITLC